MARDHTLLINTFIRSETSKTVMLTEAQAKSALNVKKLLGLRDQLHPRVQSSLESHRKQSREAMPRGQMPNFAEGKYVLADRSDFQAGPKLCLCWRGPRKVFKYLSNYIFQGEDLCNGQLEDLHSSRLKLFPDTAVNETHIMSHVLQSQTRMVVSRILSVGETPDSLFVRVCGKGFETSEDSLEPIAGVYEDVPAILERLLLHKITPSRPAAKRLG